MNKIFLPILILSFYILSCDSDQSTNQSDTTINQEENSDESPKEPFVLEDGTEVYPMIDGKEMRITPSLDTNCTGLNFEMTADEQTALSEDTLVRRSGDTLFFTSFPNTTGRTKSLSFINPLTSNTSQQTKDLNYRYQGNLKGFDAWVVEVYNETSSSSIIIDKFSLNQVASIGKPIPAPDKRFILVGNSNLKDDNIDHHLAFYRWNWDDNNMELLVKAVTIEDQWVPLAVVWEDDYHFSLKRKRTDSDSKEVVECVNVSIE
jgi:hypothetical protein